MTQRVLCWYNDSRVDQCNQIESREIDLCIYGKLICDRGGIKN